MDNCSRIEGSLKKLHGETPWILVECGRRLLGAAIGAALGWDAGGTYEAHRQVARDGEITSPENVLQSAEVGAWLGGAVGFFTGPGGALIAGAYANGIAPAAGSAHGLRERSAGGPLR